MCGIVGIAGREPVNQRLYDALTVLQHRGQDAAGIVTSDGRKLNMRKANGLVRDVFRLQHMQRLVGDLGIGHVRLAECAADLVGHALALVLVEVDQHAARAPLGEAAGTGLADPRGAARYDRGSSMKFHRFSSRPLGRAMIDAGT